MKTTINVRELHYLLDNMPSEQVVMLKGKHGIGKSSILTDYYTRRGMKVVTFFLGQMSDPGDLIGLPNKDEKTGKTVFLPPYWFPTDGKPIVLFLDELNRARPELLQAVMDLVLNKQLAGKSLPKGSIIMSAVNDGDEYSVNDLDPALVSRFNVYTFKPSFKDWIKWAESTGVDKRVITFLKQAPEWLDGVPDVVDSEQEGLVKSPDRRAWKKVSDYILSHDKLTPVDRKAIAGIVGDSAMVNFIKSLSVESSITPADVLEAYDEVMPTIQDMNNLELASLAKSLLRYISKTEVSKNQETNAISFVNYLVSTNDRELLVMLSMYYKNNMIELDTTTPALSDVLFKVLSNTKYGRKN